VIWHIVRFEMAHLDEPVRREVESALAGLAALEDVRWLRVARDLEDPTVTGLITVFDDVDALARYRVDPEHAPVLAQLRDLRIPAARFDIATDDDPDDLP
jgi:hypothetical protein